MAKLTAGEMIAWLQRYSPDTPIDWSNPNFSGVWDYHTFSSSDFGFDPETGHILFDPPYWESVD